MLGGRLRFEEELRASQVLGFGFWIFLSRSLHSRPMSSIGKLMKQAAKMQQQMERKQAELAEKTVEATSGGGAVKVIAKCDGSIGSIKIDPDAVDPDDVEMLEDMILTAVNSGLNDAKEISNREMGSVTQGIGLPGLL